MDSFASSGSYNPIIYAGLTATTGGNCLSIQQTTGKLTLTNLGVANNSSAISLVAQRPYFLAAAYTMDAASSVDFIATDLQTGQIFTDTILSPSLYLSTSNHYFTLLNNGSGGSGSKPFQSGGVAAAMAVNTRLSPTELLTLAADPWSFWYPRRAFNVVGVSAAAGFNTVWARPNSAMIGRGLH